MLNSFYLCCHIPSHNEDKLWKTLCFSDWNRECVACCHTIHLLTFRVTKLHWAKKLAIQRKSKHWAQTTNLLTILFPCPLLTHQQILGEVCMRSVSNWISSFCFVSIRFSSCYTDSWPDCETFEGIYRLHWTCRRFQRIQSQSRWRKVIKPTDGTLSREISPTNTSQCLKDKHAYHFESKFTSLKDVTLHAKPRSHFESIVLSIFFADIDTWWQVLNLN